MRRDVVARLAVFAFARIPLLIALGAHLDDKVPTLIFQRHRTDDANAWAWPDGRRQPIMFDITRTRAGAEHQSIALIVNLSGKINEDEIAGQISTRHHVYTISPVPPTEPGPTLISSMADLSSFEAAMRRFLATIEAEHGKAGAIDLFPSVGVSPAVTMGRVLMANISPAWNIFDRGPDGTFFMALQVRR